MHTNRTEHSGAPTLRLIQGGAATSTLWRQEGDALAEASAAVARIAAALPPESQTREYLMDAAADWGLSAGFRTPTLTSV